MQDKDKIDWNESTGIAIRGYQTEVGPTDHVLFVERKPVGIIRKFLIPIIPEYHDRLFPDFKKCQMRITDYSEINIPGNAIKKAYLSNSAITKIRPGDILLFYRSHDQKAITSNIVMSYSYADDLNNHTSVQ